MMTKPAVILALEDKLQIQLHPAPTHGYDPVRNVMACRRDPNSESGWLAQYALHPDGTLAGLQLYQQYLTDEKWTALAELLPLEHIEALNLRENALSQIPGLDKMARLRFLDLCDNQLEVFSLPTAPSNTLDHLWLSGNPFTDNVLKEKALQGRFALLEHLKELSEAPALSEELFEARLLIIGEPGVGKTSLRHKLNKVENSLATESTKGIDLDLDVEGNAFEFLTPRGKRVNFRYQVWDFGGQRQYHPTHQLFFSDNALYLLVTNTRQDHKNEGDVEFWLETVEKLATGSPVLRVENKESDREESTNWSVLNKRFPGLVKAVFSLNLAHVNRPESEQYRKPDSDTFSQLKESIEQQLKGLKHVGSKIEPSWQKIREDIAQKAKEVPHIDLYTYRSICSNRGQTDPEKQLEWSKTFHNLGIFLHYQHNPVLRDTVILRNDWAIAAVFAVLDSKVVKESGGVFQDKDLAEIWSEPEHEKHRRELRTLLETFELCYPLPKNQGYVVPQCMPVSPPEQFIWDSTDNLQVDIEYGFMPRAIITRLIVKLHTHIAENRRWVWKQGAVISGKDLRCSNTWAYLQEIYKKNEPPRLSLQLRGPFSEYLFREINSKLDDIHEDYPDLAVEYLIYCPCSACKEASQPGRYKYYDELLFYSKFKGKTTIECRNLADQVSIEEILKGIFSGVQAPTEAIRNWVEAGELKKALNLLKPYRRDEVSRLLGQLNEAELQKADGRIPFDELMKVKANIAARIIQVISP